MKVAYTHVIPAPIAAVLDAYSDEPFYVEKQKHSGAITVEILDWSEDAEGRLCTRARITEPSRLPSFIRKSDVDTFVDQGTLDPKAGTLTWKIIPSVGADKFFLSGKIEFRDQGAQTQVVYNTELSVKIPLVGKKVEKYALDKTEEETAKQAAFLKVWVAR